MSVNANEPDNRNRFPKTPGLRQAAERLATAPKLAPTKPRAAGDWTTIYGAARDKAIDEVASQKACCAGDE